MPARHGVAAVPDSFCDWGKKNKGRGGRCATALERIDGFEVQVTLIFRSKGSRSPVSARQFDWPFIVGEPNDGG